jgi:cytochrome c-type biogenesis protein CcmF
VATATVFIGTFYPLFVDLMGTDKISIGAPYYNRTFVPLFIPLLITMVMGPFLKWKRDDISALGRKLVWPLIVAVVAALLASAINQFEFLLTCLTLGLAAWIVAGSFWVLIRRCKIGDVSAGESWRILASTPRAYFGLLLGHVGLGLVVAAIAVVTTWQQENITALGVGEKTSIANYEVRLVSVEDIQGPNYVAERGKFEISQGGLVFKTKYAERHYYQLQKMQTNQTAIHTNLISNIYIAMAEPDKLGRWVVRIYYHPLAPWLWIGGFVMALGGFISLSDRRFRAGDRA